jgi:hypothetical protein
MSGGVKPWHAFKDVFAGYRNTLGSSCHSLLERYEIKDAAMKMEPSKELKSAMPGENPASAALFEKTHVAGGEFVHRAHELHHALGRARLCLGRLQ